MNKPTEISGQRLPSMTGQESIGGITLTEAALDAARHIQQFENTEKKFFRLYLDGKGCDGFFYGIALDDQHHEDICFLFDEIKFIVDEKTWQFIKGSRIDWVDDARGRGFIIENPRHDQFQGKFYKDEKWQEKLINN